MKKIVFRFQMFKKQTLCTFANIPEKNKGNASSIAGGGGWLITDYNANRVQLHLTDQLM